MAELLNCVFCKNSNVNLILFKEETLKKCQTILKHRKEHNLKFKDIVLPADLFESGYHRQCYKSFTGLMKKYYSPKATTTKKSTPKKKSVNITENSSAACSSTSKFDTQCIEMRQSSISQFSSLATSSIRDTITIPEPTIMPELIEPVPSNLSENNLQLENIDPPCETNTLIKSNASTDQSNIICIFCDRKTRKHRSKRLPLHSCDKKDFFSKLDEENENHKELINKIVNYSFVKICYHHSCRLDFFYRASAKKETPKSDWHGLRQHHQTAFEEISALINENIIEKGRCYFLTYLHRYYMDLLHESEEGNYRKIKGNFTPHNLEIKITKAFDKQIKFLTIQNKKLVTPKNLISIDEQSFEHLKDEDILHKAALLLRKSILQTEKIKLPQLLTAQHLEQGEVSIPQDLLDFYSTLIAGSNRNRKNNPKCIGQVKSYCEDVVYGVHNGKVKTSKHIMLGMSLKSLTSSRKIIDIIHRYGHCISYPAVEELETEETFTSVQKSSICPGTIVQSPLCTGGAFDNFDWFVEPKNGKDILHDTVGIIYQNNDLNTPDKSQLISLPAVNNETTLNSKKRRRRTSEAVDVDV